jgi:hypothetical protein
MAWLSLVVVAALGITAGFFLPLPTESGGTAEQSEEVAAAVEIDQVPQSGVTLISTAPKKLNVEPTGGSELERIMGEGWEDPSDSSN